MSNFNAINRGELRGPGGAMTVEEYRRQERTLETACKQFEGTMFSKIWKDMMKKSARNLMESEEKKSLYGALEETAMEMVSEHLSESQGVGVWKVLYDSMHKQLPVPEEIRAEREAQKAAAKEQALRL